MNKNHLRANLYICRCNSSSFSGAENHLSFFQLQDTTKLLPQIKQVYTTGFVQYFDMKIHGIFKDYSRTKLTFTAHACRHRNPKIPKTRNFLAHQEFSCTIVFNFFRYFFELFFALFIAVNELNSKHSQISRSLINL